MSNQKKKAIQQEISSVNEDIAGINKMLKVMHQTGDSEAVDKLLESLKRKNNQLSSLKQALSKL